MSRTVTTPGGDEVLLLDDEELAEMIEADVEARGWGLIVSPLPARIAALAALWYSGPIEDPSGQATARLVQLAAALDPEAPPVTRGVLDTRPVRLCWESEVRGKRTFRIQLVGLPERWVAPIEALAAAETAAPEVDTERGPRAEPEEVRTSCPPPGSALPESLVEDVAELARDLVLARIVRALSGPPESPQAASEVEKLRRDLSTATEALVTSQDRLAQTQDYARRLRRGVDEAQARIGALTAERDGLLRRLRVAEGNVRAAMNGDTRAAVEEEVRRRVAAVMRDTPKARSIYDEEEGR